MQGIIIVKDKLYGMNNTHKRKNNVKIIGIIYSLNYKGLQ